MTARHRAVLTEQLAAVREAIASLGHPPVALASVDEGDVVSHHDAMEAYFARQDRLHRRARALTDALAREKAGVANQCVGCDGEIPEARLLTMPTTRRCVECQADRERRR